MIFACTKNTHPHTAYQKYLFLRVDLVATLSLAIPVATRYASVCSFVFRHSADVLCTPSDGPLSQTLAGRERTMENVLPILELWLERAHAPMKLKVKLPLP